MFGVIMYANVLRETPREKEASASDGLQPGKVLIGQRNCEHRNGPFISTGVPEVMKSAKRFCGERRAKSSIRRQDFYPL